MDERDLMDALRRAWQYVSFVGGCLIMVLMGLVIVVTIVLSGMFSITYLPNQLRIYWNDWTTTIRIMWRVVK